MTKRKPRTWADVMRERGDQHYFMRAPTVEEWALFDAEVERQRKESQS